MYCKHCGSEIDKDYVFCWHCRKRVNPISGVVFKDEPHNDVIDAYTVLSFSKSGEYLIGNLGVGFVILDKDKKKLVIDTLFEDVIIQGIENVDSMGNLIAWNLVIRCLRAIRHTNKGLKIISQIPTRTETM